jgi:hypothetical protein
LQQCQYRNLIESHSVAGHCQPTNSTGGAGNYNAFSCPIVLHAYHFNMLPAAASAAAMQWRACSIPSQLPLLLLLTTALQETVTSVSYPAAARSSYTVTIKLPPADVSSSCQIFLLPGSLRLDIQQDEGHFKAAEAAQQQQPAAAGAGSKPNAGTAVGVKQQPAASLQDSSTAAHAASDSAAAAAVHAAAAAAASATAQPLQQQAVAEKGLSSANSASSQGRHLQDALQSAAAVASST